MQKGTNAKRLPWVTVKQRFNTKNTKNRTNEFLGILFVNERLFRLLLWLNFKLKAIARRSGDLQEKPFHTSCHDLEMLAWEKSGSRLCC